MWCRSLSFPGRSPMAAGVPQAHAAGRRGFLFLTPALWPPSALPHLLWSPQSPHASFSPIWPHGCNLLGKGPCGPFPHIIKKWPCSVPWRAAGNGKAWQTMKPKCPFSVTPGMLLPLVCFLPQYKITHFSSRQKNNKNRNKKELGAPGQGLWAHGRLLTLRAPKLHPCCPGVWVTLMAPSLALGLLSQNLQY